MGPRAYRSGVAATLFDRCRDSCTQVHRPQSGQWLDECLFNRVMRKMIKDSTASIGKVSYDVPMQFISMKVDIGVLSNGLQEMMNGLDYSRTPVASICLPPAPAWASPSVCAASPRPHGIHLPVHRECDGVLPPVLRRPRPGRFLSLPFHKPATALSKSLETAVAVCLCAFCRTAPQKLFICGLSGNYSPAP